ncbi:hypothetical protein BZA05DRAFT_440273 [Tricharina praecox]|uniref:uncharacterized protein n=1 Tax=Tricharina praecox TaxID=43433 RepID=UPI00221FC0EE|nr:uncharacterized protein BZA05DRAFT_440273 [Tricharina praecox]KAI5858646.1 hypothetical protein BZA05DRAFT_440273 [Tricharina praecox]
MPSIGKNFFQKQHSNRAAAPALAPGVAGSGGPDSPRLSISPPIALPGSAVYTHPTIPTLSQTNLSNSNSNRASIQLVPSERQESALSPSSLHQHSSPPARLGEFAAEYQPQQQQQQHPPPYQHQQLQQLQLQQQHQQQQPQQQQQHQQHQHQQQQPQQQHNNGGGSTIDLSDNSTINNNNSHPSASSSVTSLASAARQSTQSTTTTTTSSRKPGGFNLFSSSRDKSAATPSSPQPGGGGVAGLGRRISVRHSNKHQPPQQSAAPPDPQPYQPQQQQQHHQHHHQPQTEEPHPNPYLQQQPLPPRPQSILSTPRENEVVDYNHQRGGEYTSDPQRQSNFGPPPGRQSVYYEHGQEYQQQQQKQQQQQQQQPHPQHQHQQQQQSFDYQQQPQHKEQQRPVDAMVQQGPPVRGSSSLGQQIQQPQPQQQQYAQHQSNPSYSQNQAGVGGDGQQIQVPPGYNQEQTGRATPEVRSQSRAGDMQNAELQATRQELETLQTKYRKVKSLYFDRSAEIERLQNTLAHQRLAQSRTSLDDNEYTSRFERLDGAIKNVAFEIRQSWKTIPSWLHGVINAGAAGKGGREMTVVGRASISRWVVDEILEQFFHPALESNLSMQLKEIERNIRLLSPMPQTGEEHDALSVKVCNWRLTTLDSLHAHINSERGTEARQQLGALLVNKLFTALQSHLNDPPPPGLMGGIQMVVDIAIGLAANLPVESREVRVWYPLPGDRYDAKFMKIEGGLPPLGTPMNAQPEGDLMQTDNASNDTTDQASIASKDDAAARAGITGLPAQKQGQQQQQGKAVGGEKGFGEKVMKRLQRSTGPQAPSGAAQGPTGNGKSQQQQQQQQQPVQAQSPLLQQAGEPSDGDRLRVAGFMAVEVRGRSILVKAPVWI